jgi:hypothetical protein
MVEDSSEPPKNIATSYKAMKAYFWCKTAELGNKTADSGIAATFVHDQFSSVIGLNDAPIEKEYVGWVEEILELDYKGHCVVVLCSWIKGRYTGPNPTIRRDEYGFLEARLSSSSLIGLGPKSFMFPIHVQQVYFSVVSNSSEWQVVYKVLVRGQRGDRKYKVDCVESFLSSGRDAQLQRPSRR